MKAGKRRFALLVMVAACSPMAVQAQVAATRYTAVDAAASQGAREVLVLADDLSAHARSHGTCPSNSLCC